MDYNATTPLEVEVSNEISASLISCWANPSSNYKPGKHAKAAVEKARGQVADMISAQSNEIIFTSGGTEANHLVIHTALEHYRQRSSEQGAGHLPHVVTTTIEHDAIKFPLEHLQRRGQLEVTFLPVSKVTGTVVTDDVVDAIRPNTCLVTIMLANNETGVIHPIRDIVIALRARLRHNFPAGSGMQPVLIHTDAAQAIGKVSVNVGDLGVDYLTIVGHKFYGPRIGALYVRKLGIDCPLYPLFFGGGQERSYRPGTENTAMIVGLGKAAEMASRGQPGFTRHFCEMKSYLEKKLLAAFGDRIHFNSRFGDTPILPNTVNVSILGKNFQGRKVLSECKRLMASVGAACHGQDSLSAILLASGIPRDIAQNALRLSLGRETTESQIDAAVADLLQSIGTLEKLATREELSEHIP